ncbi:MAG: SurA N-terminal domain-containing protein, partial [Thermoanaerobaculia bacterium]|nr:SurA N-terminal domain-containing protein [Thermoanaerobaculia bacterium]
MLKVFRDNLKYLSWVLWLVIVVFILFLFTDFGGIMPNAGAAGDTAARVGDYEISFSEFEQAYRQQEAQLEGVYGDRIDPEMARQIGLYRQVMDSLIARKVLLDEAGRLGVSISDEEVRKTILAYPVFQSPSGGFVGEEEYQRVLRNAGWTADNFERSVREDLLTDRVRTILIDGVYVSDAEVEASYRERVEKAKIRFVRLESSRFADEVAIAPDELAAWFEEHRERFRIPERRLVDYLLIDRNELQATIQIDDAAVQSYYDENREQYTREEQVRARHILVRTGDERTADEARRLLAEARSRIEAGEDFAALAAELSDDPGTKDRGGDLGLFGRGQMVGPFEEAAFSAAVGELVGPVETTFGLHLIEVLEQQTGGVVPLPEVAPAIRSLLLSQQAAAAVEARSLELADRIQREKISEREELEALAEEVAGVTLLSTEPFGETDNVPGIGRSGAFAVVAFETAVGEVSEPVAVSQGRAILRVREIQESRLPELDEVRSDVETALRRERQEELAHQRLAEARERILAGGSLDEVAGELGIEVQE